MSLPKYCLSLIIFALFPNFTIQAQCDGDISPGESCITAPLVGCKLDGYVGSNRGLDSSGPFSGFCGNVENDQHFKFIVQEVPVAITVTPLNCDDGEGLQIMLYRTSDCVNYSIESACSSFGTLSPLNVIAQNVQVGDEIYMIIDGFAGDLCDYKIDFSSGLSAEEEDEDNEEPNDGNSCQTAIEIGCDLHGYIDSNERFDSSRDFPEICGLIENDQHFKFIVKEVPLALTIIPSACEGTKGLQAVLYTTSDCKNYNIISNCASFGIVSPLAILTTNIEI